MRIGIISDTHIGYGTEVLPSQLKEVFKGVDLILHAGDIYVSSVLDELGELAPVLAARGDDDLLSVNGRVKDKHALSFEGFSLWLTHMVPWTALHPLLYSRRGSSAASDQEFETALNEIIGKLEDVPDILVFGDTHQPFQQKVQGALLINPGSPTLPNYHRELGTVGILTLSPGKAEANIIQL